MGFGHRVYRNGDSRVPTMTEYFYKTAKYYKNSELPKISKILEDTMLREKNIKPKTGPGNKIHTKYRPRDS